ncbi:hypothetical protein [Agrobacterium tumefaciens]|uniref:hypothetical protein n=1 Tax=Agrobacterium tumefaciens TaxID=358 RepID=UPI0021CF84F5|nr:hypothetical protein [Agrobacterium tumefaciens]UXT99906.1 hypothetical protein FY129_20850 [Agrobacterium tumefaciens]
MTAREQENRQREKARVARLADIADRCKGDRWEFDADGNQTHIIARRSTGERVILGTIYAEALPDEVELLTGALEDTVLFLTLRQRAIIALKSGQRPPPDRQPASRLREGDFAANAAMLCADPLFHRFLERRDQTRAIHNKDHADTVLKKLIGITSKTQLNREERAQAAFIDLRSDFEAWKGGRS